MRTFRTVSGLRETLAGARASGETVGLVPTMGAFHEGHLSLMRRAREQCDRVVVSLFVNPAQFNQAGDLDAYPRDETRDAALAAEIGVDVLFAPPVSEVYPAGFATTVSVAGVSDTLEGAQRGRGHFDGVATVLSKLFGIVAPDLAYFGQKDFQQTLVVKRLVLDLNLPIQIEVCPIVREPDGLAMSSRNVRLSPEERRRATALHWALLDAEQHVRDGITDPAVLSAIASDQLLAAGVEPEYFALVDPNDLTPVERIDGHTLLLVAARVGGTRLIDNHPLSTANTPAVPAAAGSTNQQKGI
jgi:pantoate--beta-alanine ligase